VRFLTAQSQDVIKRYYKTLVDHIHTDMQKPVLISPYYNEKPPCKFLGSKDFAKMWANILSGAPIDCVAVQDGMGVNNDRSLDTVVLWLSEMQSAIKEARPEVQLWANVETMKPKGKDFEPGDLNRVAAQVNAEKPYVSKVICFSFNHYQSPNQGFNKNYDTFKSVFENVIPENAKK
jgi:hypothetical protein